MSRVLSYLSIAFLSATVAVFVGATLGFQRGAQLVVPTKVAARLVPGQLTVPPADAAVLLRYGVPVPGVLYEVKRVVDGDTFVLANGQTVRMLGVNTPESTRHTQWYGKQAADYLRGLVEGHRVYLQGEPGAPLLEIGGYGRMLAYVFTEDERDVCADMIRRGLAFSFDDYECARLEEFQRLESLARDAERGLWNAEARQAWEARNTLPDIPRSEAKLIGTLESRMLHALDCSRAPAPANGVYFRDLEEARKHGFTKRHSCLKREEE